MRRGPRCALLLAAALATTRAANPLVADVGMADPHLHFWPETGLTYAYATHDFSNTNTGFRMDNWWVWSSPDLISWTLADVVYPNATPAPPGDYHNCWATDGAHKKNATTGAWEYFFYMSIGTCQVAVLKSTTTPAGPWVNVLGAPLLNASFGASLKPAACFRDPGVFEDDDGAHYLIAGVFDYYIMRLVTVLDPTGPYGAKTDDKPFIHKANGLYYLSWGCFYGTSASVYGPYEYKGSAIDPAFLAPAFRLNNSVPGAAWYSSEDLADRHGSFWVQNGQTFYASNDRSHSTDVAHRSVYRDTVVGYVHYYANASIAPVAIDGTGVGAYDGARVEAENFMALAGGARKAHAPARGGGFVVAVDGAGATLFYPRVRARRGGARAALTLVAANAGAASVRVVARRGSAAGELIAACDVAPSRGAFAETACAAATSAADGGARGVDVHLSFEGAAPLRFELDAFALA